LCAANVSRGDMDAVVKLLNSVALLFSKGSCAHSKEIQNQPARFGHGEEISTEMRREPFSRRDEELTALLEAALERLASSLHPCVCFWLAESSKTTSNLSRIQTNLLPHTDVLRIFDSLTTLGAFKIGEKTSSSKKIRLRRTMELVERQLIKEIIALGSPAISEQNNELLLKAKWNTKFPQDRSIMSSGEFNPDIHSKNQRETVTGSAWSESEDKVAGLAAVPILSECEMGPILQNENSGEMEANEEWGLPDVNILENLKGPDAMNSHSDSSTDFELTRRLDQNFNASFRGQEKTECLTIARKSSYDRSTSTLSLPNRLRYAVYFRRAGYDARNDDILELLESR